MIRRPPRSTQSRSSAASDVYKRQDTYRRLPNRPTSTSHIRRATSALSASHPLDETVDHLLAPGLLEIDGQLVAVDRGHPAIAELLVENARADIDAGALRRARGHQGPVDGQRFAARRVAALLAVGFRPLPARRVVKAGCEQVLRRVEPARPVAAHAVILGHLHM